MKEITDYEANAGRRKTSIDMRQILNYENVKGRIIYKLINTERNNELLKDIPYIKFLDLSIVFQYMITGESYEIASMLVYNVHMKLWDVTVDELLEAARVNTPYLMEYEFKSMNDTICEIIEAISPENLDYDVCMAKFRNSVPMYVLSNRYRIEGATCMLYPRLLSNICDKLESSFYIIPSSIHEVLILPANNTDTYAEILAIIKEINDTQVEPEEILSYSLYYYDKKVSKMFIFK